MCTGLGNELRTFNTDTTKQLKQIEQQVTTKREELQVFKRSSAELKVQLETARKDSVEVGKKLSETTTKLSEADAFTKSVVAAVDSTVAVGGEVTNDLVNSTVAKIHMMKNEIAALKKKIAEMTSKPTHPPPKATPEATKSAPEATKGAPAATKSVSETTKAAPKVTEVTEAAIEAVPEVSKQLL